MGLSAIHPGKHLKEELEEIEMSATELARKLNVADDCIRDILNGKRALTNDLALRLAALFGTSPEFWNNLQALFEARAAKKPVSE